MLTFVVVVVVLLLLLYRLIAPEYAHGTFWRTQVQCGCRCYWRWLYIAHYSTHVCSSGYDSNTKATAESKSKLQTRMKSFSVQVGAPLVSGLVSKQKYLVCFVVFVLPFLFVCCQSAISNFYSFYYLHGKWTKTWKKNQKKKQFLFQSNVQMN